MLVEKIKELVFELRLPGEITQEAKWGIADEIRKCLVQQYNTPNIDPIRKGHIKKTLHYLMRGCFKARDHEIAIDQREAADALEAMLPCFDGQPLVVVDGPRDKSTWIHMGEEIQVALNDKAFQLAKFVWDSRDRTAKFDDILEQIWGDDESEDVITNSLRPTASKVNQEVGKRIGWKLTVSKSSRTVAFKKLK